MKLSVSAVSTVVLCLGIVGWIGKTSELGPEVSIKRLAGDSLVMSWNSVQTGDQPIARYEFEIKKVQGDTLIVNGQTTALSTVFIVPSPPAGDSMLIYGKVRAVNTRGKAGSFGRSPNFVVRTVDQGPAAPTPIIRDTTLIIGFRGIPSDMYSMAEGDSVETCAIFIVGSQTSPATTVRWSVEDTTIVKFGNTTSTGVHCRWLYALKSINDLQDLGLTRMVF